MNPHSQFEREEEALAESYENGEISLSEYRRLTQELAREYRGMAEEAAERAYSEEMERW